MKKRLLSILLAMMMALSILPTTSLAASSVEEALGEIDIYNGGTELSYLMINGRVRTLIYTYYNYVNAKGETREIPAYCVNPNITGVPQTVGVGESIEYDFGGEPDVYVDVIRSDCCYAYKTLTAAEDDGSEDLT